MVGCCKGRRAERVGTLVEDGESGEGGDTGRGWGVAR